MRTYTQALHIEPRAAELPFRELFDSIYPSASELISRFSRSAPASLMFVSEDEGGGLSR